MKLSTFVLAAAGTVVGTSAVIAAGAIRAAAIVAVGTAAVPIVKAAAFTTAGATAVAGVYLLCKECAADACETPEGNVSNA